MIQTAICQPTRHSQVCDCSDNAMIKICDSSVTELVFFVTDTDEVFGEDNVWHDTLVLCGHMVADTVSHLQARMRSFDPHVSEFLMTLQRVHPPNITRVSNIEDLKLFRESLLRSAEHNTLSAETINAFINIHSDFISKVRYNH